MCRKFLDTEILHFIEKEERGLVYLPFIDVYGLQVGPKPRETSVKLMALGPPDILITFTKELRARFSITRRGHVYPRRVL